MSPAAPTLLALLVLAQAPPAPAPQPPPRFGPSPEQQARTQADHRHLLQSLGIAALRPGASGNPSAPNAANADGRRWVLTRRRKR